MEMEVIFSAEQLFKRPNENMYEAFLLLLSNFVSYQN